MRKSIKKIAASLLAATMVLGSFSTVLAEEAAETPEVINYSVVGTGELGITAWDPAATDCVMTQVSNSVYKLSTTATGDNATAQFKIVKDGENMAWAQQLLYGTSTFGDNMTQFQISVATGDTLDFYANIVSGEVVVVKNGATVTDMQCLWDSKPEWEHAADGYVAAADAFAAYVVGDAEAYSVVGDSRLGIDWVVDNPAYYAVDKNGVCVKTLVATAEGNLEFKVVKDGANMAWSQQLLYGTSTFGDNMSQFQVAAVAGDVFEVYFAPATGDVTILKNGAVDATALVKWDTKPEWEFAADGFVTLTDAKAKYVYADADTTYSVVGSTDLVGLDWAADNAQYMVGGTDGVYKKVVMATKDSDALEFKIVQDGPDMGWNLQLALGLAEFGDNKSQFRVAAVAGDVFEITFTPATGDVNVTKNGAAYDYLVRWATRDEDPTEFLTKAEALATFVNTNAGGGDGETTTAKKDEETTTAKKDETTKATQSPATGDVAPVAMMVVLFAAVAVVAVVAKKKEA